ncbi:hypothetical protein [Sporosarcina sp. G11-34]|uniref:hypothetical protein n=1 Tax=Sporosarcina sp. G11-34 TaxID=2849605 RepID=UPI0022A8E9AA|nr:hypothetical protein [Sporosarcina sp. G11-34]MCZ2258089.1 hypothetical protein [Sporosarcina sp. G11-34]
MKNWKQAFLLAKFELRHSKFALLTLGILLILYVYFIADSASAYLGEGYVLFDPFFLIVIGLTPVWVRPKDFQLQKIANGLQVNPYFVTLHQLPIPKEVLIKNRLAIYYMYSVPFNTLFFTLIYVFSDAIQSMLTLPQYAAFSFIWISFGIYWGSVYAVTDVGEATKKSTFKSYVYMFLFLVPIVVGMVILHKYSGHGVIYWSMILAKQWPLLASILSVIATYISTIYWIRYAHKIMKRIDYSN